MYYIECILKVDLVVLGGLVQNQQARFNTELMQLGNLNGELQMKYLFYVFLKIKA